MKRKISKNKNTVKFGGFIFGVFFLFAIYVIYTIVRVGAYDVVDGINLKTFSSNRNTAHETLTARRGTIYDRNGNVLAQDVNSYTVIAYLSPTRTDDPDYPRHVVDKESTAEALAPLLGMKKKTLINLMSIEAYQVELGPGGRGITELLKDEIEALDLPGIDFIETSKRYYPYGDFLSYTLGYAKTVEDTGKINGEFGLELYYNDILSGEDGYREYQQDLYGYKIVGSEPIVKEAKSGDDIYLTIDVNIQMFLEQAIDRMNKVSNDFITFTVADAKTGEILGTASNPSFDPNIKSYYDPLVSYAYEPGSIMKIYSWMASMENGQYNGKDKFKSGQMKVADSRVTDWYLPGWGDITYDHGFMISSNVGATKLAQKIGRTKLMDFYYKLGFGKQTGITLPGEFDGQLTFKYDIEVANASFGQGILTTPVQHIAALTTLTNDGTLLKPYLVSKITNGDEVKEEYSREEVRKVASTDTINKMKKLMYDTVNAKSKFALGTNYAIKDYDICGKTGTAQYASPYGGYAEGKYANIKSFAGFFPYDDPEIVFYVSVKDFKTDGTELSSNIKSVIKDISTYMNIYKEKVISKDTRITLGSYINKDTETVKELFEKKKIILTILGNGNRIINQYPQAGTTINKGDRLFLQTNDNVILMPDMSGYSRSDVLTFTSFIGITPTFIGSGYVTEQSIKEGEILNGSDELTLTLVNKFIEEEKEEQDKETKKTKKKSTT